MELVKGSIVKQVKRKDNPLFASTTANSELTYKVTRVNAKSYTLECIDGYMKGTGCKLLKSFLEEHTDVYGTVTKWEVIQ